MKKHLLFVLLMMLTYRSGFCQQDSYLLPLPAGWGKEKISFPVKFAPEIPFRGTEELRFTPGWGKQDNEDYWSYAFLWFLEGAPQLNKALLQDYLTQYFTGLYLLNKKPGASFTENGFTHVELKLTLAQAKDKVTYEGYIKTLDYMTGKNILLNARIHIRNIETQQRTAVLFEISPQPYQHSVWKSLGGIVTGFQPVAAGK